MTIQTTVETITAKQFFDDVILARHLVELCLVEMLHQRHEDGSEVSKEELLEQFAIHDANEKKLIKERPRTALALYTILYEGDTIAAKATIKHIKTNDRVAYYKDLIQRQKREAV